MGVCPACPGGGGEGEGGYGTSTLVTCLGSQGTLCPCSSLMIRVGRPWNLLLLLVGPGPISLMHSARSNNRHPKATQRDINSYYQGDFRKKPRGQRSRDTVLLRSKSTPSQL